MKEKPRFGRMGRVVGWADREWWFEKIKVFDL